MMTTQIGLCRVCLNRLGRLKPLTRSFYTASASLFPIKDVAPLPPARTKFSGFSSAVLTIRSGTGGNGCIAFEISRTKPGRGTPSGGNGGRGGDVYVIAHGTGDLRGVPPTMAAENGENGEGSSIHGRKGKDVVVQVPIGTVVREMSKKPVFERVDEFIHSPIWDITEGKRGLQDWQI